MITYRRNLLRYLDRLGDRQIALLDGALQVDILDLFAQIGFGADESNQTILDDKVDVGSFRDWFKDGSCSLDNQLRAAIHDYSLVIHNWISILSGIASILSWSIPRH